MGAFQKKRGLIEALAATCPVRRTRPNAAPAYDELTSLGLTVLWDGRRFAHAPRLRQDPTLNELFGLEGVVGDTLRRFAASVPEAEGAAWVAGVAQRLWGALPEKLILDLDATAPTKYGQQEGAAVERLVEEQQGEPLGKLMFCKRPVRPAGARRAKVPAFLGRAAPQSHFVPAPTEE